MNTESSTPSDSLSVEAGEEEVKGLSLYDAVSRYTELKPSGPQFKGLSPFTVEKTPSFYVHPTKLGGCWKCFSTGEGGRGVESFLEKAEKSGKSRLNEDRDSLGAERYYADSDGEVPF